MNGRYHTQINSAIVPVVVLGLIFYLGFGWEYLLSIPVGIYFSTFPDIDQKMSIPKRWRIVKFILQASLLFAGLAAACVIGYFIYSKDPNFKMYALYAAIVLIGMAAIYGYSTTENGKFLFAHRGFTHTLIPSILLFFLFKACNGFTGNPNMLINYGSHIGCIIIIGMLIGITGHIFADMECLAGCPILWPITKKPIHFGNAITSDPKAKDRTHVSSKIWSAVTMVVFYALGLVMILHYFGLFKLGF